MTEEAAWKYEGLDGEKDLRFHVEMALEGPPADMDAHLKWIEGTALLAGRRLLVQKGSSTESSTTAPITRVSVSTHFWALRPLDAALMGMGLMSPAHGAPVEVTNIVVSRCV